MKKKGCAAYSRVSTIGQITDRHGVRLEDSSPEAQKLKIENHLKLLSNRDGVEHTLKEFISDEGYSGKNNKRPGYQRLLHLIKTKQVDTIIASELSRLSRDVKDFLDLVAICDEYGVDLIIIGMDLDTSSAFGRFMVVVLVALAQFEREMTAKRVKENITARLLQSGKINGGNEILGLVRSKSSRGHFEIEPNGIKVAEKILNWYLKLPTRTAVIKKCNDLGIRNINGNELSLHSLSNMIKNCEWRYSGKWHYNLNNRILDQDVLNEDEKFRVINLPHGAVLNKQLCLDVLKKASSERKQIRAGKDGYNYLLSSVLVDEDGSKYGGQPAKGATIRYYYNPKIKQRIQCHKIDELVIKEVKDYMLNQSSFDELAKSAIKKQLTELPTIEIEIKKLKLELSKVDNENKKLRKRFLEADGSNDTVLSWLNESIEDISKRRQEIETEHQRLIKSRERVLDHSGLSDVRKTSESLLKQFDIKPNAEKKVILGKVLNKVVIRKDNCLEIHFNGPEPEFWTKKSPQNWRTSFLDNDENGGSEGTRTLGLLRDRQTL
jgi:DNA invertase Pin-like site-specific DNA recombinase